MNHFQQCIALSGLLSSGLWAAEHPAEQDFFQEFPVVLSASRLAQPVSETPNAMTVIDRAMIVASGARNIADLFKLVPGMYVGYQDGHTPIVSYAGNTDPHARRMQVLVDGRSIYLPPTGEVNWAELPLDINDIDKIEVVRGASAASHGSNSVLGVINIITLGPAVSPKAEASARWGQGGVSDAVVRFANLAEQFDYRVTLATRGDSGLDTPPNDPNIPLMDNSRTQLANAQFSYRPSGTDTFDVRLGYSDSVLQLGNGKTGASTSQFFKTLRNQKVSDDFEQLVWLHTAGTGNDLQLNYFHIGRNSKDDRYTVPLDGKLNQIASKSYLVADDAIINRNDIELQHTLSTSPDNRLVWGMGMRQDQVDSPNNLQVATLNWREYRLFAHDEYRITPQSLVNIGAMVEKNALDQTRISPRISYNYHLTPRHTLRAGLSVAYRNPDMLEELGSQYLLLDKVAGIQWKWIDTLSAGGLSPEHAISREIGYVGQMDDAGSTLDVRAYHDQIDNIIWFDPVLNPANTVSPQTSFYGSFHSDFNAYHSGLESTLNYKLAPRSKLTMNYAYQVAGAMPSRTSSYAPLNDQLVAYANRFHQTVPKNSASLLFSQEFSGGTQLGAGFYHTDPVRILDSTALQPLTRYLDVRLAQRLGSWQRKKEGANGGEIALVLQNALSDHYVDYATKTNYKRRAYLSATFGF